MPSVKEVRVPGGTANQGDFKVRAFNLFDEDDAAAYAELRTRANDRSSGIKIEHLKEVARKETTITGSGEDQVTTVKEDLFMMVTWWEKPIAKDRGDDDDDDRAAKTSRH